MPVASSTSAVLAPSNAAEEIFPDSFGAEALDVIPLDALTRARAFEQVAFTVSLRSAYVATGITPPLELVIAAPSGRHEVRELVEIPLAVAVTPLEGGPHRVTVREVAHNRWWGGATFGVDGDPAS